MTALDRRLRGIIAVAFDGTALDVRIVLRGRELGDGRVRPILVLTVPGEQRSFDCVNELLLDAVGEIHRRRARCDDEGRLLELSFALDEALDLIAERTDRWNLCFEAPQGVEVAALCRT